MHILWFHLFISHKNCFKIHRYCLTLTSPRTLNHIKQFMLVNSFWVSVAVPSFEVEGGVRMVR